MSVVPVLAAAGGDSAVIVGPAFTVKQVQPMRPPSPLMTLMTRAPVVAVPLTARLLTVSCAELTHFVPVLVRPTPLNTTTTPGTKLLPVTVMLDAAAPWPRAYVPVIVGAGVIVMFRTTNPPSGLVM